MSCESKPPAKICVPVCARTVAELAAGAASAAARGDLVEFRLDCLNDPLKDFAEASQLISNLQHPAIITLRPAEQGGHCDLSLTERKEFWIQNAPALDQVLVDLEFALAHEFAQASEPPYDWNRVVCSHHDFEGVPTDLDRIYDRLAGTPARIVKIAVQANDVTDCLPIFSLLERARREGRELIAIAMGAPGVATRILGPARGGFLTYGALAVGRGTAPGQATADDLRELYHIDEIDCETRIMGIIGCPVSHSASPYIHCAAFASAGINAVYLPLEVRNPEGFLRRMVHPRTRELDWNLRGLSVTAPHKTAVMDHLDWIDPIAKEIGAVNTIVVEADSLLGYNTDAAAFLEPLKVKFGTLKDARCAILGAGGAATAAVWSLKAEGAAVTVFARQRPPAKALAERFGAADERLEGAQFAGYDLVINCTPLGTSGAREAETAAATEQLQGARLAYDMVYNPSETQFLKAARAAGCETLGGLPMLLAQAAQQFTLWTGHEAPIDVMRHASLSGIESSSEQAENSSAG